MTTRKAQIDDAFKTWALMHIRDLRNVSREDFVAGCEWADQNQPWGKDLIADRNIQIEHNLELEAKLQIATEALEYYKKVDPWKKKRRKNKTQSP